jgi:ABC-2 type transport system ATP-binding protein
MLDMQSLGFESGMLDNFQKALQLPHGLLILTGPNGSGKTTAIRCMLGIERPDAGTISVLGRPIREGKRHVLASVGYMPQEAALYGDLTVRANLEFFGTIYGLKGGDERSSQIRRALQTVRLEERAGSRVRELSAGMRRRASLACAILHSPALLLLDEPTVGVDPDLRANMWATLRALAEGGSAILMTTHYLEEAERCDRVVFLREGRIIGSGAPQELLSRTGTKRLEDAFLATAKGVGRAGPQDPPGPGHSEAGGSERAS